MVFPLNPKVIDLSHYDEVSDLAATAASGIVGVINKATEGPGLTDKTFALRREACAKAGLAYGAYHFLRPGNMAAQAKHFLDAVGDTQGLLLALDHEDPKVPLAQAKEWLQHVHDAVGRWPVLYSGFLVKQQLRLAHDPLLAGVRLWLAQYGPTPQWPPCWRAPWLWQYTGDGSGPLPHNVPGVSIPGGKGIDISSYAGTDDQLRAEWSGEAPVASAAGASGASVGPAPSGAVELST